MAEKSSARPATGSWSPSAILRDMVTAWRLLWDPRVPAVLKLVLPIAAPIYWLSPLDLMPGLPFDDLAVLVLAFHFFVQAAPSGAVRDARRAGEQAQAESSDNAIETTWRVVDDK